MCRVGASIAPPMGWEVTYRGTQICRVHSYTVLYTFKIYRSAANILELERSFGYRLQPNHTSLLSLLLALVASIVLVAPPPPVKVLLGWHLEHGTSAEVRVPALCLPCLASLVPSLLPNLAISLLYGKLRPRTDTALGTNGSWGSATSS